jgi:prepilin-type N-terminal cleavage/methylation domain-containing protein
MKIASSQVGFTLVEVVCALTLLLIAAFGFFNMFAFGEIGLEKQGRRNQALAAMQGEMEYWRARFALAGNAGIAPAEAARRKRKFYLGENEPYPAELVPMVFPRERQGDVTYQRVAVAVIWGVSDENDTVSLEGRFYAP